jgi:transposase
MREEEAKAAVAAHYGMLLGITKPWMVKEAKLEMAGRRVDIEVVHDPEQPVSCPQCRRECARHDHAPERTWRHLDVMQFTTQIRARLPRCACAEHGVVTLVPPWAEPGSRFTLLFEAFAVQVISACASLTQAAELLRLDWDSVQRVMDRAVARGLARRSTAEVVYVGLDEKSFGRGQNYVSVMTDLKASRVLEVVEDRTTEAAKALWQSLPEAQRTKVQAASMDMGANFAAATRQAAPGARIVHDRFHVAKLLNEAVDKVRREEHRRLLAKGDESLKHTKFLWLQGAAVEGERALSFAELCERDLKTARAWVHKETFQEFWSQPDGISARRFHEQWHTQAMRSKLEPIKQVALALAAHLDGLLNYFDHRITNALTEGFNSRIQAIKAAARGFRRFQNYRTRILFFCGKLNLAPHTHPSAISCCLFAH